MALTWEIWRRNSLLAWLAAAAIAACVLGNWMIPERILSPDDLKPFYSLAMVLSFGLVFGIFHCAEFSAKRDWHGFQYRLFTLPVPTFVLVACPMVLGVLSVELVYFAWARFVFAPLGLDFSLWPAAVLGVGLMAYQAIVWSLGGFRITRIIMLALAGMLFMDLASLPLFAQFSAWPREKVYRYATLLLIGLAGASFLGACYSVDRQRHGGGRGRGWLKIMINQGLDALPRRRRGFASPSAAQFWLEWRRAGWLLPGCVGAVLLLIFVPVSWFTRKDPDATLWTLGWAAGFPILLAAAIGKGFAKPDFWSADTSLPAFLAVRPLASGGIIVTKMKVAALGAVLAWLLVLAFLSVWLPLWADTKTLGELWRLCLDLRPGFSLYAILVLLGVAAFIISWKLMVAGMWVGFHQSRRCYLTVGIAGVIALVLAISVIVACVKAFSWKRAEEYVTWLGWGLASAVILKLWLAAFSWNRISRARTWKYLAVWLPGTGCFLALGWLACPNIFWLKHLVILAALLPMPLARLGLAHRSLENNRHR
jgi:hypothetical protein